MSNVQKQQGLVENTWAYICKPGGISTNSSKSITLPQSCGYFIASMEDWNQSHVDSWGHCPSGVGQCPWGPELPQCTASFKDWNSHLAGCCCKYTGSAKNCPWHSKLCRQRAFESWAMGHDKVPKLQALLTVTLWRTKLLPSRECSPSAAKPSGSHPPQGLWCHKCHMKSFVQRASAHLKCPHLRNLPCQHPHARIPCRKNTCSHLAVNPTCICKQTIPSLTQKVIKDWHTTAMTKKAHSACLYHSTSTSRRRLTKENTEKQQIKQRVDQTSTRNRFRIKNIFDVAWYHPSEIVHLQVSLSLKIQQKIPDSPRFLDLSQIQAWDYTSSDSSIALQLDPKKCHTMCIPVCSVPCPKKKFASVTKKDQDHYVCFCLLFHTDWKFKRNIHTHQHFSFFGVYIWKKKDKKKMYVYCFISKWSQVCSI